jgi:hypothetical protein
MFKSSLSISLICVMLWPFFALTVAAQTPPEKEAARLAEIKVAIAKLGTGPNARINVKLRDKTKVSGYVSGVDDAAFVITDPKTSATTKVSFADVYEAKGRNTPLGVKIAVTAGIVAGAFFLLLFVIYAITYKD